MAKASGGTKSIGFTLDNRITRFIDGYNKRGRVYADFSISRKDSAALSDKVEANFSADNYSSIKYYLEEESFQQLAKHMINDTLTEEEKKVVDILNKEMKPLPKSVTVYRMDYEREGTSKVFSSTSLRVDRVTAYKDLDGKKKIHAYRLPRGTKAIVVNGLDSEVILPPGFNFKKHKIL